MSLGVTSATDPLQAMGVGAPSPAPPEPVDLGQNDFLTLMMTQLKAQDPMKPMDSSQFLAQLAQFSTVSGIESLNKSFGTLAGSLTSGQTLQASQLVGREVLVSSYTATLDPSVGVSAAVDLPGMVPDLSLEVYDPSGQLVRSMSLAGQGPGLVSFKWDGLDDAGEPLPAGPFQFSVTGSVNGQTEAFETFTQARVESVSVEAAGEQPLLTVAGLGQLRLDQVREIR